LGALGAEKLLCKTKSGFGERFGGAQSTAGAVHCARKSANAALIGAGLGFRRAVIRAAVDCAGLFPWSPGGVGGIRVGERAWLSRLRRRNQWKMIIERSSGWLAGKGSGDWSWNLCGNAANRTVGAREMVFVFC